MLTKDLFTEKDGESFCPARLGLIAGLITFIVLSVYSVIHTGTFDFMGFGTGFGSLVGGSGAGIWMKGKAE